MLFGVSHRPSPRTAAINRRLRQSDRRSRETTRPLLCVGGLGSGMSWADLFDRARTYEVSLDDVTDALERRRDG